MSICYLQCSYAEGQISSLEVVSSCSISTSVTLGFGELEQNDVTLGLYWVLDAQNRLPYHHNFCQVAMMTFSVLVMAHYKQ